MAEPRTVEYHEWIAKIGDGESPETFAAPCGLSSRGLEGSANVSEMNIADCEDEQDVHIRRGVSATGRTFTGEGVLDQDDHAMWEAWFSSRRRRNAQFHLPGTAAQGGGHYEGPFVLTQFNITGTRDENAGILGVSVQAQSAGKVRWVPAAS